VDGCGVELSRILLEQQLGIDITTERRIKSDFTKRPAIMIIKYTAMTDRLSKIDLVGYYPGMTNQPLAWFNPSKGESL
jgi:hypothetical protein